MRRKKEKGEQCFMVAYPLHNVLFWLLSLKPLHHHSIRLILLVFSSLSWACKSSFYLLICRLFWNLHLLVAHVNQAFVNVSQLNRVWSLTWILKFEEHVSLKWWSWMYFILSRREKRSTPALWSEKKKVHLTIRLYSYWIWL